MTALCRVKGLDVKQAWPLAKATREASEAAKTFEIAKEDALARHGLVLLGGGAVTLAETTGKTQADVVKAKNAYDAEMRVLLSAPFEFGSKTPDAGSVAIGEGALTGDLLAQVMEFVKGPE